jgi:molecular chaperone HtpG
MVAKKVTLETKAQNEDAVLRSSLGDGKYELQDSTKTARGTTITLYLNSEDDNEAYADVHRLRGLIKQHSNYVPVAIQMLKLEDGKPGTDYETINEMQSLRTKRKADIKQEEYVEFYKAMTYSQE